MRNLTIFFILLAPLSTFCFELSPMTCQLKSEWQVSAVYARVLFFRIPILPVIKKENQSSVAALNIDLDCSRAHALLDFDSVCRGNEVTTNFSNPENMLEKNICMSAIPSEQSKLIAIGSDVPADFINAWSKENIRGAWGSTQILTQDKFDYENLLQLNLESADVWQALLLCANGSAELARDTYKNGAINCGSVRDRLKALRSNVINFYQTAELPPIELVEEIANRYSKDYALQAWEIQDLESQIASYTRENKVSTKPIPKVPSLHPLFVQMSFEELANMNLKKKTIGTIDTLKHQLTESGYRLAEVAGSSEKQKRALKFTNNLGQLPLFMPQKSQCNNFGLWPIAARAVLKQLQISAIQKIGLKALDYGVVVESCQGKKLPSIYNENSKWITDEYLAIRNRYN